MIAAVTGATGYVGRFILERLLAEGVTVRAWRRPSSDLRFMPEGVEWIAGDLESEAGIAGLVGGADMLVHAALQHAPGRYRGGEAGDLARYLKVNVSGSLALLAAAHEAGVGRCVVLSSRAVFGRSGPGAAVTDDAPVSPDTHYGASKVALEAFVQSWGAEGWPVAALRPTGVYGMIAPPERSKWFGIVAAVLRGEPVEPRAGTEVHGRDVAEAVWRLLRADPEAVAGRAFNCSDIVVSTRDIVALAHGLAGVEGPLPASAPAPAGIMRCDGLARLGVRFGGRALLEKTVAELVEAARRQV